MTLDEMAEIIGNITYKPNWSVHLFADGEKRPYIQVEATTLDSITKVPAPWRGAKHYLSPFMCRQEIVGMALHAIEDAEMHELREFFRYKGAAIYNPHLDPDVLVGVAKQASSYNLRENAMSMKES